MIKSSEIFYKLMTFIKLFFNGCDSISFYKDKNQNCKHRDFNDILCLNKLIKSIIEALERTLCIRYLR